MTCGSHVVQPYKLIREGGGFKETGGFMLHGQYDTDVEHSGCGGMFYTTDGVFIASYYEKSMY